MLIDAGGDGKGPLALAGPAGILRNLVSYHLQPLVAAGLVTVEKRGREMIYRADPLALNRLAAAILTLSSPGRD